MILCDKTKLTIDEVIERLFWYSRDNIRNGKQSK